MSYTYIQKSFTYDGKRYYVKGKTDEEAIIKRQNKIAELERGKATSVKTRDTLFKDYAREWHKTYKQGIGEATRKDILSRIENNIIPVIGHIRMKDITKSDMQKVMNSLAGYSADRCRKIRQTMSQIFETALDDDVIIKLPNIKNLDLPEHKPDNNRRTITAHEREITLLTAKSHYAGAWVLTMLYCGLRPQETAALQGRHIDIDNKLITVEQALKRNGIIGETKGTYGTRLVPFPELLIKYFKDIKPFDFVFLSKEGRPMSNNNMGTSWKNFKREMQLNAGCRTYRNALVPPFPIADDLVPYCYRHTFATDSVTAGISIVDLKDLMGHTNISVTSKYYVHMTDERIKKAADLLDAYRS